MLNLCFNSFKQTFTCSFYVPGTVQSPRNKEYKSKAKCIS